ncbi:MAG: hypothetical protein NZ742_08800, partial [Acidobacteria bacterium]|nr:hypothetical protein [Acidobacteriota bacterium]MDW7984924.1 hypothetical protein [Acidobacteriota bacterium]
MVTVAKLVTVAKYTLIIYLIILLYVQIDIGIADNGDFYHYMRWFVSKPAGFETNWPPPRTPDWKRRFFLYYLPYWETSPPPPQLPSFFSSAPLLWWPGVI